MDANSALRDLLSPRPADAAHTAPAFQPVLVILADLLMTWIERASSRRVWMTG